MRAIIGHYELYAERARRLLAVADARRFRVLITSKGMSKRNRNKRLHAHYLITAIDVDDLSGYRRSAIAGEKNSGRA
jgi:hypothetical protein